MHIIFFEKDIDNFEIEHKTMLILELFGVGGAVPPLNLVGGAVSPKSVP